MTHEALPTTIRVAKDDEFETIGKLHALAFADDQMYNILFEDVDPSAALKSNWIDGAKAGVAKGHDTVLVLEKTGSGKIIGEAWFYKFSKDNQPMPPPDSFPEGFNKSEDDKMAVPRFHWQQELMEKYGEFMYLQEFAITPDSQLQGLGKKLMLHVIELAKKERLNIAITADAGKPPFYAKFGFQEVGDPIMIGPHNTIEGVTKMILELFPPESHTKH